MIETSLKIIKWDGIFILHEFQQYLTRSDFIKVSLLNKVMREKLKHIIFYSIELNQEFLRSLQNYFIYFELSSGRFTKSQLKGHQDFKTKKIDPFTSELVTKFGTFSTYLKCLKLTDLTQSGYYITPSIATASYLTSLSLFNIVVNIRDFYIILSKLEKLECLCLKELRLIKLPEEKTVDHEAPISPTLKELSIYSIHINETSSPNNPYQFVYESFSRFRDEIFYFKLNHHINLKKFKLYSAIYSKEFVLNFLALNTQLIDIRLPTEYFTAEYINILSDSNNISNIRIDVNDSDFSFSTGQSLSILNSLDALTIGLPNNSSHVRVYDIIYICPNLTKLDIAITTYTPEFINKFLRKLKLLKVLKLKIQSIPSGSVDLNVFSNIEIVKMDINDYNTIYYALPNHPMKFKSITFSLSPRNDDSFNLMRQHYKNNSNWKITLSNSYMKFISTYN